MSTIETPEDMLVAVKTDGYTAEQTRVSEEKAKESYREFADSVERIVCEAEELKASVVVSEWMDWFHDEKTATIRLFVDSRKDREWWEEVMEELLDEELEVRAKIDEAWTHPDEVEREATPEEMEREAGNVPGDEMPDVVVVEWDKAEHGKGTECPCGQAIGVKPDIPAVKCASCGTLLKDGKVAEHQDVVDTGYSLPDDVKDGGDDSEVTMPDTPDYRGNEDSDDEQKTLDSFL